MSKLKERLANDTQNELTNNETIEQNPGVTEEQLNIIIDILNRVNNSADDIKSGYYSLLDNLNALNKDYPNVYNEFKLLVKLPNQTDIKNIVQSRDDIQKAIEYLTNPDFLSGVIR